MSTPSIIVGRGNWGAKATSLLGYSLVDSLYLPREFTCSRAGNTATRVNQSGNIEVVNADVPRIDYFGGQAALLVEPSAENVITNSEIFIQGVANWVNTQVNVSSGYTSPSNSDNASFIESISVGSRMRLASPIFTSGTTNTFSIFAKIGTQSNGFTITVQEGVNTNYTLGVCQVFLLDSGTLGASGSVGSGFSIVNSRIENYGNGWYRCSISVLTSFTPSAATITIRNAAILTANLPTVVPGNNCYIWGVQLETGSVATSYIPTTAISVTRAADVVSKTGVSSLIGQTEGTIYLELEFRDVAAAQLIFLDVGGSSQYIRITKNASNAINALVLNTSGSQSLFTSSSNPVGTYKLALGYKNGDYAMSINGGTPLTSNNTLNYPTSSLSRVVLSDSMVGFKPLNGRIRDAEIYPTRLPNVAPPGVLSLQSLTAI
jgi:hypothetical protein